MAEEELKQREDDIDLDEEEREDVEESSGPSALAIHEIIRRRGDEELERPTWSLWWSGVAGGVAISASVLGQALFEDALPDAEWAILLSSLGYTLGFLIVVLGRLQLFTESTLSAVIPVATHPSIANGGRLLRFWAIVLAANMVGTFLVALMTSRGWLLPDDQVAAMLDLSRKLLEKDALASFKAGIPAGFLIAAVPWALPSAKGHEFWVILFFTYFIALGGFAHVVAGSTEAWLLALSGEAGWGRAIGGIMLPTLLGNILGGTGLFALLAHAQVSEEL